MAKQFLISIRITVILLLLVSGIYPLVVWGLSQAVFPASSERQPAEKRAGTGDRL